MVITREFTKAEFYTILASAPPQEADDMINYARMVGYTPWDYFQAFEVGNWGIIVDDVPIYWATVIEDENGMYKMWTLRNKEIKCHFTMYKLCKRRLKEAVKLYSPIFTMNYVKNKIEAKWNMRMGFIPFMVENDIVHFRLDNHKGG